MTPQRKEARAGVGNFIKVCALLGVCFILFTVELHALFSPTHPIHIYLGVPVLVAYLATICWQAAVAAGKLLRLRRKEQQEKEIE